MAKGFDLTPGERKALLIILFLGIIGTILTAWRTSRTNPPQVKYVTVQVEGAVTNPGIYRLPIGSRVEDALQIAGGLRMDADISKLNLVAKLKDGQRINVPSRLTYPPQNYAPQSYPQQQQMNWQYPYYQQIPLGKIDVNTATKEELASLPGIGPALAERIIQYRLSVGRFYSIDELLNVPGVGEKKLEKIKPYIEVR
ncbi:helix-hairpin-helix domain-containing protein [bacterium]|nr:helix-hairpin-helix domain-containing protein [bacterium]